MKREICSDDINMTHREERAKVEGILEARGNLEMCSRQMIESGAWATGRYTDVEVGISNQIRIPFQDMSKKML